MKAKKNKIDAQLRNARTMYCGGSFCSFLFGQADDGRYVLHVNGVKVRIFDFNIHFDIIVINLNGRVFFFRFG